MPSLDPQHPNILFILTDDQGCWAMGCAGNTEIRTPHLDALADSGLRFENFFCTSPVCSPARASILTGRIPSQHGVHDWLCGGNSTIEKRLGGRLIEYLKGQPGYTDILARNGYVCGLSGKWHLGDAHHVQKGFSFWEVHAMGGGPYYGAPLIRNGEVYREPQYVTDVITDNALKFLDGQMQETSPFYLGVHYTAPHSPWARDQHPKDLYEDYHENCPFHSVPNGLSPPQWAERLSIPVNDAETRRGHLSGYYAAVSAMDANVGRLLEWLESNGLRQNTLVIFTSDNGMNMGHHGVYGKGNATFPLNMFDESVKVPMLISQPGIVSAGVVCDELLSQYDIMPTLLDYVGIEPDPSLDLPGQSFAALLQGAKFDGRENVVVYDEYGPVRMIRNREWKYVHRYPYGPHELYDLVNDADEATNLATEPEHQEQVREMRGRLEEWFLQWADPRLDGTHEAVTGRGQFGLAGQAANGRKRFVDLD